MFNKLVKKVKAWLMGEEEVQVAKVTEVVQAVQPIQVANVVDFKARVVEQPKVQKMTWAEMKANNEALDSYFNRPTVQPALKLVA